MLVLRHIHRRKQKTKLSKSHQLLDRMIYLIAVVGPIMTIPQIMNIWIGKSTQGVSIYTFGSYLTLNFVWIYYGYIHRDRAIMFSSTLWTIANSMVVIGLLMC